MAGDEPNENPNPKPAAASASELVDGMAHEENALDGKQATTDPVALASRLQHLSLSTQTIHADDFLNSHPSVAPPMHVATTFRYDDDPDKLVSWRNINVRSANPLISNLGRKGGFCFSLFFSFTNRRRRLP